MSLKLLAGIDKGCLAFVVSFILINLVSLRLIEDLPTKLIIFVLCTVFSSAALAFSQWQNERQVARVGTAFVVSLDLNQQGE